MKTARQQGKEERRLQWIASLDSVVSLLRWTTFFDTGDDYRQSLPLWKCSHSRNGELVSAELDEMLDYGFGSSSGRRATRMRTSATAATLPISAEAKTDDVSDNADGDIAVGPTDGVIQRMSSRSPNVLPADLFRRLIETYLALGDAAGAAEVASWMRDEAKVDLARTPQEASEFVDRIKAAVKERDAGQRYDAEQSSSFGLVKHAAKDALGGNDAEGSQILRMLAGQRSTARTKTWWTS